MNYWTKEGKGFKGHILRAKGYALVAKSGITTTLVSFLAERRKNNRGRSFGTLGSPSFPTLNNLFKVIYKMRNPAKGALEGCEWKDSSSIFSLRDLVRIWETLSSEGLDYTHRFSLICFVTLGDYVTYWSLSFSVILGTVISLTLLTRLSRISKS